MVVKKASPTIDGNLDDWADIPGVTVAANKQEAEVTEMMRRPWLDLHDRSPKGTSPSSSSRGTRTTSTSRRGERPDAADNG